MNKLLNNKKILFSIPLIIIGLTMVIMGTQWMISEEPWMLDKTANEERLEISFDELFKPSINDTLPGYLKHKQHTKVADLSFFFFNFFNMNFIAFEKLFYIFIKAGMKIYFILYSYK